MKTYPIRYDAPTVAQHIAQTARTLQAQGVLTDETVYIVLMNGGCWFAMHLFDCLGDMHNAVYFVKAHSYDGAERGALSWDYLPEMDLKDKQVVILDDICDSGETIEACYRYLTEAYSPRSVKALTLLRRSTTRVSDGIELYSCIVDPTESFFVGCGLDDYGLGRMLPYVGIIQ